MCPFASLTEWGPPVFDFWQAHVKHETRCPSVRAADSIVPQNVFLNLISQRLRLCFCHFLSVAVGTALNLSAAGRQDMGQPPDVPIADRAGRKLPGSHGRSFGGTAVESGHVYWLCDVFFAALRFSHLGCWPLLLTSNYKLHPGVPTALFLGS